MNMRLLSTLIVFSLLLSACVGRSPESTSENNLPSTARILHMRAPDMFCVGCSSAVEGAVMNMPGVISAKADLITKEVNIIYDSTVTTYEAVFNHGVFDVYGREFVSDEPLSK